MNGPTGRPLRMFSALVLFSLASVGMYSTVFPLQSNDVSLGKIIAGEPVTFSVVIVNRSIFSVDVVGGEKFCTSSGCATVSGLPVTIPPFSSKEVEVEFISPGKAEFRHDVILDCYLFGYRPHEISIAGSSAPLDN